jgi:hypothetical protein
MKEGKLFISYKQLLWCIIVLTITFQIIVFFVSYKSFFQDKFGFFRFLIIVSFLSLYGTVILKGEINSTAIHLFGVFTMYFFFVCGVEMLFKYLYSDLLNNYIQYRVEEIMRSSPQELAGRGFQFDASASMNAIEISAIDEVSNKRTLYIGGLKILLAIPCCYIFAFFKSLPVYRLKNP